MYKEFEMDGFGLITGEYDMFSSGDVPIRLNIDNQWLNKPQIKELIEKLQYALVLGEDKQMANTKVKVSKETILTHEEFEIEITVDHDDTEGLPININIDDSNYHDWWNLAHAKALLEVLKTAIDIAEQK